MLSDKLEGRHGVGGGGDAEEGDGIVWLWWFSH